MVGGAVEEVVVADEVVEVEDEASLADSYLIALQPQADKRVTTPHVF